MTLPGQLSHGMGLRPFEKEAMREIAQLKAQVRMLQAQTNTVTQYVSLTLNNQQFTSSWAPYGAAGPFTIPAGFQVPTNGTNLTLFLWAASGITFTTAGNIGIQVASGTSPGSLAGVGPAISIGGGSGQATSVTTVYSASGYGGSPGTNIYIGAMAYASGTYPANSGNVHVNGVLIWTRS